MALCVEHGVKPVFGTHCKAHMFSILHSILTGEPGEGNAGPSTSGAATTPIAAFGGHRKAVAYVRWAGQSELLSASTDSMLRLWDVRGSGGEGGGSVSNAGSVSGWNREGDVQEQMGRKGSGGVCAQRGAEAVHTYSGHTNERNFVGLSHTGNYIATGSETGEVSVLCVSYAHFCLCVLCLLLCSFLLQMPAIACVCVCLLTCVCVCVSASLMHPAHHLHRARHTS